MNYLWRLFDSKRDLFYNRLTVDELRAIVNEVPEKELKNWRISREGDLDWKHLSELRSRLKISERVSSPGNVMSTQDYQSDLALTKTGVGLPTRHSGPEQRKLKRLLVEVPAIIDFVDRLQEISAIEISLVAIKFDTRFTIKYKARNYGVILKTAGGIALLGTPLVTEKELLRGTWNVMKISPNLNLEKLRELLK